jgi:Ca2+-binding EF-hand superfamily protein
MSDKINKKEVKKAVKQFIAFDKNGNGKINVKEIKDILASLNIDITKNKLNVVLKKYGLDKDRTVALTEFLSVYNDVTIQTTSTLSSEEYIDLFRLIDADENGFITGSELRDYLNSLNIRLTDEEIADIIAFFDSNNDGQINYEEFIALYDYILSVYFV